MQVEAGGRTLPLVVRRNARATRIILRLAPGADRLLLTLPPGASLTDGLRLATGQRDWIALRLAQRPPPVAFADGAVIPYRGQPHRIHHDRHRRGVARSEAGLEVGGFEVGGLEVGGPAERLAATLRRWLRAEAEADLAARSQTLAARLGRPVGRVRVRDLRSRWGSCSAKGDLSYAWRLILAPDVVRAYVAAHEVAHLACRGHDARFWATVALLQAEADIRTARAWLRTDGPGLFRYG